MRLILSLILCLPIAACDSAGPAFRDAREIRHEVEGSRFTLRFQGALVEATRTSPEWMPRFEEVARKAGIAAQIHSGCRAAWVQGDPAMMWIGLSCNGAPAPKLPRRTRVIQCSFEAPKSAGFTDLQCRPTRR